MRYKSYKQVNIYILKEIVASFFVAFLFFFFIFFVNYILLMAEKILSKRVPFLDVVTLLICYMPQIISLAFPFSALVGALMAIGRFSSDNEILAFRASGISLPRLFVPVLFISIVFTVVSFVFNDYFLPLGFIKSSEIYRTLFSRNPGLELEPYSAKNYEDKVIITGGTNEKKIEDVIIIDRPKENKKRIITAKDAELYKNKEQEGVLSLEMRDVFSHETEISKEGDYEYSFAQEMIYNILIGNIIGGPTRLTPTAREMTSFDVYNSILEKQKNIQIRKNEHNKRINKLLYDLAMEIDLSISKKEILENANSLEYSEITKIYSNLEKEKEKKIIDQSLRVFLLEFQKKFSHPFSCIVFLIFAFPVGLFAKRSGKILGFGIGVMMSGIYWGMLFVSYRSGYRVDLSPFLVIWFPNIIVFISGILMFVLRTKK